MPKVKRREIYNFFKNEVSEIQEVAFALVKSGYYPLHLDIITYNLNDMIEDKIHDLILHIRNKFKDVEFDIHYKSLDSPSPLKSFHSPPNHKIIYRHL